MNSVIEKPKIVLTGGSGFLGYHLLNHSAFKNALAIGRSHPVNHAIFQKVVFDDDDGLALLLQNKDVVVHAAARAHVMDDNVENPLGEYRSVNTFGTLNLARQAAIAGVKRFIFVSSIKVANGLQ